MANHHNRTRQSPQQTSYSAAIARAIEWLGDRYLLAEPMMSRSYGQKRLISDINLVSNVSQGVPQRSLERHN